MSCHVIKSDIGHTRLRATIEKNIQKTFASPSKIAVEKKKKKLITTFFTIHLAAQGQLWAPDNEAVSLTRC